LAYAGLFGDLMWTIGRDDDTPHMNDYARGVEGARHLVRHLATAEADMLLWERIYLLRSHLDGDHRLDWPDVEVESLRGGLNAFLARREWPVVTERALWVASDHETRAAASRAAEHFRIPMFDHAFRWLREGHERGGWVRVMEHVTPERIDDVLAYALATIQLTGIPQEPGAEPYYHGSEHYQVLFDLEAIVGRLNSFPERGWELIRVALRLPGWRERELAVRALESWPGGSLNAEQRRYLTVIARGEPLDELGRRIRSLADG
jgi:hypothetical protein